MTSVQALCILLLKQADMERTHTILCADDDPQIREVLRILLENEGYRVIEARSGAEAVQLADEQVDLYILDIMMPGLSGLQACQEIRKASSAPILFLTAKTLDADKTMGFALGADDYVSKPFSASELIARVKANLRRYVQYGAKPAGQDDTALRAGDISLYADQSRVLKGGQELALTDTEYRILHLLLSHRKKIFSVQNIYESVWEEPYFYSANNTVMVHVRNLRRKLGDGGQEGELIKTVWGRGYRID